MEKERIRYLLHQYSTGLASAEEQRKLFALLTEDEARSQSYIADLIEQHPPDQKIEASALQELIHEITSIDKKIATRVHFLRRWGWAAASIVIVLATAAYFWMDSSRSATLVAKTTDIAPGRAGAILTLADGSQVVLDSLKNGVIASQIGSQVVLNNGHLQYDPTGKAADELAHNVITTPRGRQFQLTLPDGTRAWLNAASSIRYPTVFTGGERRVEVSGEVYLEVAPQAQRPFLVDVKGKTMVEVLGTDFNVNAYTSTLQTTLLQGRVRVGGALLEPGQLAQMQDGKVSIANNIDIAKIMAWKNGQFNFDGMRLREVMAQLERWYDIEVLYEGNVPDVEFYGKLDRNISLGGVIAALKDAEVHFRIDGRKLIVLP